MKESNRSILEPVNSRSQNDLNKVLLKKNQEVLSSEVVAIDVLVSVLWVLLVHELLDVEWSVLLELQPHARSDSFWRWHLPNWLLIELLSLNFLSRRLTLCLSLGSKLLMFFEAADTFKLPRSQLLDESTIYQVLDDPVDLVGRGCLLLK